MKREPKGKFDRSKLIDGGTVELPLEQHEEAMRQTTLAEQECREYRQAHADLKQFGATSSGNSETR